MRTILAIFLLGCFIPSANSQVLSTSNEPSQVYSSTGKGIPGGASVYGHFVGRTACQEFLKELNLEVNDACKKRKMSITLYWDSVTHSPTEYETHGMGKYSGKGKWYIVEGRPSDPAATVFQIQLASGLSLFLLKGDENVIFILDRNRNFLHGNGQFSYTLNRAR